MRDVAKGLEYLHNMQPSIVHGELDVVSLVQQFNISINSHYNGNIETNILITDKHRACIADFRLSTGYQSEALELSLSSLKAETDSLRWMAPELLSGGGRMDCNVSSDVYAFGCVVYSVRVHIVVKTQDRNN